ncbi:hypothetical protein KRP22_012401 [Phytophthora ramorum]|nr:hypothetical protein KRP22_13202 [Phytophthora ramorum]
MRAYLVLTTIFILLVNPSAATTVAESATKKTFTIMGPNSKELLDGVYYQEGGKEYLILSKGIDDESDTAENDSGDDNSGSDGQEERAVSADVAGKLKKTFSGKYNTPMNKFLWRFFRALTPKENRPTLPRRIRRPINPGNVS